jgi:dTDP-4-dehydrorhamnose 3,5-epimerase
MNCGIDGVIIRALTRRDDKRGWLTELFRRDEIESDITPAMAYVSLTRPGIARGPHEHRRQTDYFCFIGPSDFRLFLWDNRIESPTFGARFIGEFGEKNMATAIIPPGVIHAYKNIGDKDGLVYNFPNRLYRGEGRRDTVDEIRYEDLSDSPYKVED